MLAAVPSAPAAQGRRLGRRAGLIAVALAQLAVTVPLLIMGHDHDAGVHAAHELGSFDLALAIAFAVGAIRPALSAGLAPCGIAAAGLMGTAIIDVIGGQAFGADEAQHLIAVAGAALLFWQARNVGGGTSGSVTAAFGPPESASVAVTAESWGQPESPPGGTAPDTAARVPGRTDQGSRGEQEVA